MNQEQPKKNMLTGRLVTALLSVIIALAMWTYVVTVVGPEYEETFTDIPVTFQRASSLEEKGLMLLNQDTTYVTLDLSGNRLDLNKLSSANISVTVDLSKIDDPGTTLVRYDVAYPANVANDAITVQNRNPSGVTLAVVRRDSKNVPVEVDFTGTMPEDFIKEKPVLEMEEISISGPEDVVKKIHSARIQIELTQESTTSITGDYTYTLCDKEGQPVDAKYIEISGEDAETVSVTVEIKRVKEVPLTLGITAGGGATEENSSIVIDPETILVSGSEELLEGLEYVQIGKIDLGAILEDTVLTFPIETPEGITNETGIAEVTVTISFPELITQEFSVTQFEAKKVPAGFVGTISTRELVVSIRGSRSVIEALAAEDITAQADFTGMEAGSQRLDATIIIKGNPADAGAIGTYTVLGLVEEVAETTQPE